MRVYFEQQILALLLVFHQTHNLSHNRFARDLENQPISAPHFFNPQQMFLLQVKLIAPAEKRETSKETCNETMLHDKLRDFVSRISPPLRWLETVLSTTYSLIRHYSNSLSVDAKIMVSTNYPIIREQVAVNFVAQRVAIATIWPD